jgi:hypothetical protein
MDLNFKDKKVFCSFNDFSNTEFIKFINKLSEKNDVTIYTKNKFINNFFNKNIKIIISKIKIPFLYKLLRFFSKNKTSSLNRYYNIENIFLKNNIFVKILFLIKLILNFFNLPISKDILRHYFYKDKANNLNFDILFTDFRFNEIYSNHEIIYFAKKNNKPIVSFLFSWDNVYSSDINLHANFYIVGSKKLRLIISKRHKISLPKIRISKSFQFLSLSKKSTYRNISYKYILFVCCLDENSRAAKEEFKIINFIGNYLKKNGSNIKVLVRPYPFFEKKINLNKKFLYSNIVVKDYGKKIIRRKTKDKFEYMRFEKSTDNKYELIHNSIAVINFFTTLGIESIFLKKFTLFLNIKINKSSYIQYFSSHFFKVKYLDHYKILNGKSFYVNSINELSKKLDLIIKNDVNLKLPTKDYEYFKNIFLK